jgi:hypothetical protein
MQQLSTFLRKTRYMREANCRTQPLRAGRSMGPAQRVRGYAVVGPLRAHLHPQDEGRPVFSRSAQQSHQDGSACPQSFLQQPRTARLWRPGVFCSTRHGFCGCIPCTFCAWDTPIAGSSDEPTTDISQPPVIFWLLAVHASISVTGAVDAASGCHA